MRARYGGFLARRVRPRVHCWTLRTHFIEDLTGQLAHVEDVDDHARLFRVAESASV